MKIFRRRSDKSRSTLTLVIYLTIIAAAVSAAAYAGRYVIFRPWTSRTRVAASAYNGTILVIGGLDHENVVRKEIMSIDISGKSLRRVARLPSPRFGMSTVVVGENLYIFGGYDGKRYLDEIVRCHLPSREIKVIARLPGVRAFGTAAHRESGIFYFGGWNGEEITDEILRFDLVDNEIRTVGCLPEPLEYLHSVVLDDIILLFGGEDSRLSWREEIIEFNPQNGTLRYRESIPNANSAIEAALIGDDIIAKLSLTDSRPEVLYRIDTERGDKVAGPLFSLAEKSMGLSLLSARGKAFLIGGADEQFGRHIGIYEIDLETGSLTPIKLKSFVWR